MRTPLKIFLAHTPLQVLACTNVKQQYHDKADNSVLMFEGAELAMLVDRVIWPTAIEVRLSRTCTHSPADGIRYNLATLKQIVKQYAPQQVELYVSELQWMCNKAFYAYLNKHFKSNFKTYFVDEGLHFYINNKHFSEETPLKTLLKFVWMKLHGFPGSLLLTHQFYRKHKVAGMYCYHPELLKAENYYGTPKYPLSAKYMDAYIKRLSPLDHTEGEAGELLFLSQAYYWDIPEAAFKAVIKDMVAYFKQRGVKRFVLKPHHSDKPEWVDFLTRELGFVLMSLAKDVAIEIYANRLGYEYVVSVSSSALLNLKVFGYQGKVVSYGAKRCGLTKKYRGIHNRVIPLFERENVEVID